MCTWRCRRVMGGATLEAKRACLHLVYGLVVRRYNILNYVVAPAWAPLIMFATTVIASVAVPYRPTKRLRPCPRGGRSITHTHIRAAVRFLAIASPTVLAITELTKAAPTGRCNR